MKLEFRRARQEDIPSLKEMILDTITHTCKNDYSPQQINAWTSSLKSSFNWERLSKQSAWVAMFQNNIVGLTTLKGSNYIDFMYVHKDYQHQGIANLLLTKIIDEANTNGAERLDSDISITARPFFEYKGFRVIKENKNEVGTVELINYRMERKL